VQVRDESLCEGSVCRRERIQCNQGTKACVEDLFVGGKEYSAIKGRKPA